MWIVPASSVSSPASVDSTSVSEWHFRRLALSVAWRGNTRPAKSWRLAWKTGRLNGSLSGLTLRPSTGRRGVARWISSVAASPVRTSPAPGRAKGSKAAVPGSGMNSPESLARWDRDTSSWRTSQCSLFGGLTRYSERFPNSGSMLSGRLYVRPMSVPRTGGSGCSSWPTATGRDWKDGGNAGENCKGGVNGLLGRVVVSWPPVTSGDAAVREPGWATPSSHDGRRPGSDATSTQGRNLKREAEEEFDATHGRADHLRGVSGSHRGGAKDHQGPGAQVSRDSLRMPEVPPDRTDLRMPLLHGGVLQECDESASETPPIAFPFGPPAPATEPDGSGCSSGGRGSRRRLNPKFVAWLCGFHPEWTSLEPLETAWFRNVPPRPSASCGGA